MERNTLSYKSKQFLMFAGPALILFSMVIIIPFIYGLYLTFTSWDGVSIRRAPGVFVGGQLDGVFDAVLPFQLVQRFAGRIGNDASDVFGNGQLHREIMAGWGQFTAALVSCPAAPGNSPYGHAAVRTDCLTTPACV